MSKRTVYALIAEQDLDDDYDLNVMRAQTETIGDTTYWPVIVVVDGKTPDPDAMALQKENARLKTEVSEAWDTLCNCYGGDLPGEMAEEGESPESVTLTDAVHQLGEVAYQWRNDCDRFRDENARLKALAESAKAGRTRDHGAMKKAVDLAFKRGEEIDRLRTEAAWASETFDRLDAAGLDAIHDWPEGSKPQFGDGLERLEELPAENKQLLATLASIANNELGGRQPDDVAREVLHQMRRKDKHG